MGFVLLQSAPHQVRGKKIGASARELHFLTLFTREEVVQVCTLGFGQCKQQKERHTVSGAPCLSGSGSTRKYLSRSLQGCYPISINHNRSCKCSSTPSLPANLILMVGEGWKRFGTLGNQLLSLPSIAWKDTASSSGREVRWQDACKDDKDMIKC